MKPNANIAQVILDKLCFYETKEELIHSLLESNIIEPYITIDDETGVVEASYKLGELNNEI